MARINIESDLFRDRRFIKLAVMVGSDETAVGALVFAWLVAQRFWKQSDNGIPKTEWKKQNLRDEIIHAGLAEDRGDFVYIFGSADQFGWLRKRSEAGKSGGIESGKARREKIEENAKQTEANPSKTNPLPLPLSLSLSSSAFAEEKKTKNKNPSGDPRKARAPRDGVTVPTWEAYRAAYQKRYGSAPVRNATINGQLANFVGRLGVQEAPLVAEFFLTHNDRFYVAKMHPVWLLVRDAEKLRTEWDTGERMLGAKAVEIERMQNNSNNWDEAVRLLNEREKRR